MLNAIIIGASSGIGRELAKILSEKGIVVGLTARRLEKLNELQDELPGAAFVKQMDISKTESAMAALSELIDEMGKVDLIVISSGTGDINMELDWQVERNCIDVNVSGFAAMANVAVKHFISEKAGHLVGISSIAAVRGGKDSPAYNASKAFVSNYLQGLRQKVAKSKGSISITDIKPGFVDTQMAKGEGLFWVAPLQKAAAQIYRAIVKKKSHVYVTKRWRLIAWLIKILPESIYNKM